MKKCVGCDHFESCCVCSPVWEWQEVLEFSEVDEENWAEKSGKNPEDVVEELCVDDSEFFEGEKKFVLRRAGTTETRNFTVYANPTIQYDVTEE
jgi:hypothetical protein